MRLLRWLFDSYDPLDLSSFPRGRWWQAAGKSAHDFSESAHDAHGSARWPLREVLWLRDDPAALAEPYLSPERVLRPELPLGVAVGEGSPR